MGTTEGLIAAIDQVIAFFNARKMDLPDHVFDRRTQFIINGAAFETLLGAAQSPSDPLVLMLTRGPAGFRFTAKGLQHALPDARVSRGEVTAAGHELTTRLRLTGTLRDGGGAVDADVDVTLRLMPSGLIDAVEATMDPATLEKIRQARRG